MFGPPSNYNPNWKGSIPEGYQSRGKSSLELQTSEAKCTKSLFSAVIAYIGSLFERVNKPLNPALVNNVTDPTLEGALSEEFQRTCAILNNSEYGAVATNPYTIALMNKGTTSTKDLAADEINLTPTQKNFRDQFLATHSTKDIIQTNCPTCPAYDFCLPKSGKSSINSETQIFSFAPLLGILAPQDTFIEITTIQPTINLDQ